MSTVERHTWGLLTGGGGTILHRGTGRGHQGVTEISHLHPWAPFCHPSHQQLWMAQRREGANNRFLPSYVPGLFQTCRFLAKEFLTPTRPSWWHVLAETQLLGSTWWDRLDTWDTASTWDPTASSGSSSHWLACATMEGTCLIFHGISQPVVLLIFSPLPRHVKTRHIFKPSRSLKAMIQDHPF